MISIQITEETKDIDDMIWTLERIIEIIQEGYTNWHCPEYTIIGNEETEDDDQTTFEGLIEETGDSTEHSIEIKYIKEWSIYENDLPFVESIEDAIECFEAQLCEDIAHMDINYIKIDDKCVPLKEVLKLIGR